MQFLNRHAAGEALAYELESRHLIKPLVLAIPRGGVEVAYPVAQALRAPLEIIIPRKIGAPHQPEFAVGAVAPNGTTIFNQEILKSLHLTEKDLQPLVEQELKEVERRMRLYRKGKHPVSFKGRSIILVDDGLATGLTVQAAIIELRKQAPAYLLLAVPVAPADTLERLRPLVDEIVCLKIPDNFFAVGQFYVSFEQTTDETVLQRLNTEK